MPVALCALGDETTCTAAGCRLVVHVLVPHPTEPAPCMTFGYTQHYAPDRQYRNRCHAHAEPPENGWTDPDAYRIDTAPAPGQLELF